MKVTEEILQKFNQWVNSLTVPVSRKRSKEFAMYFIANHIDPVQVVSRGTVYDLFESVCEYTKIKKLLCAGQLSSAEMMKTDNMYNIASAIVWAVEHDGFDTVKYDPITSWGMDILKLQGVDPA